MIDKDLICVIDDLFRQGWTSILDIALAINSLKETYDPKQGTGIPYYMFLLDDDSIGCYANAKDIRAALSVMRDVWSNMERSVSYKVLSKHFDENEIEEKSLVFTETDEDLNAYHLRPNTKDYYDYIRDIKKLGGNKNGVRDLQERNRIIEQYELHDLSNRKIGFDKKNVPFLKLYKYRDSNYSIKQDLEEYLEKEKIYRSISSLLKVEESRNPIVSEIEAKAIYYQKESQKLENNARKIIGDYLFKIDKLKVEQSVDVDKITEHYNGILRLSRTAKIEDSVVREWCNNLGTHLLNNIRADYIPSEVKNKIMTINNYDVKLKPKIDYAQRYEELNSLLKTETISIDDLNRVRDDCWELMFLFFRFDTVQQNTLKDIHNAIIDLYESIPFIVAMHEIAVLLRNYEYDDHIRILNDIIHPIKRIIISYELRMSNRASFKCDKAKEDLIIICNNFLNNTSFIGYDDKIMSCLIGILLSHLKNKYPDPNDSKEAYIYCSFFLDTISNWDEITKYIKNEDQQKDLDLLINKYFWEQQKHMMLSNLWDDSLEIHYRCQEIPKAICSLLIQSEFYMTASNEWEFRLICMTKLYTDLTFFLENESNYFHNSTDVLYAVLKNVISIVLEYIDILMTKNSVIYCKEKANQVLNKMGSVSLNSEEQILLYFLMSFTIKNAILDILEDDSSNLKNDGILADLSWLKQNIIDRIEINKLDEAEKVALNELEMQLGHIYMLLP